MRRPLREALSEDFIDPRVKSKRRRTRKLSDVLDDQESNYSVGDAASMTPSSKIMFLRRQEDSASLDRALHNAAVEAELTGQRSLQMFI